MSVDPQGALLHLSGVCRSFPSGGDLPPTRVLDGVDLTLARGERAAIVGPSGSGKSTLLHLIGTLDRPDSGRILMTGRDLATMGEADLASVRATGIGMIFQLHHLLPQCTALENVLVPTLAAHPGMARSEPAEQRARRLLERVGLGQRMGHRPGQLSGGERQRVAVVRALINEPGLLLADEPTGALDRASADRLADLLVGLNEEEGVALLVITHDPALAARMGTVYALQDGRLARRDPAGSGAPSA